MRRVLYQCLQLSSENLVTIVLVYSATGVPGFNAHEMQAQIDDRRAL